MASTQAEVDEFVAAPKVVPQGERWRWIRRNQLNRRCHLPVESGGLRVGEVILVVNLGRSREWVFKLLRRREELLRWDFTTPPYKHRNPAGCGTAYPSVVRDLEHEHVWTPNMEMRCVRGLKGLQEAGHQEAFEAFAMRANITVLSAYESPPPVGEQLSF